MLEALPDFLEEGLVGAGAGEVDEDAAQGVYQSVGGCGEPQAQLVGTEVVSAGAVGEGIGLLFFDPVFHLATRAVVVFVEGAWVGAAVGQVGDDESWIGAFAQVFGFGDDVARAASTSVEPCAASRSDVRNLATSTWPPQVTYNGR